MRNVSKLSSRHGKRATETARSLARFFFVMSTTPWPRSALTLVLIEYDYVQKLTNTPWKLSRRSEGEENTVSRRFGGGPLFVLPNWPMSENTAPSHQQQSLLIPRRL